jgi:hypothetical protein
MQITNLLPNPVALNHHDSPTGRRAPTFKLGAAPAAMTGPIKTIGTEHPHTVSGAVVARALGVEEADLPDLPAVKQAVAAGFIALTGPPAKRKTVEAAATAAPAADAG